MMKLLTATALSAVAIFANINAHALSPMTEEMQVVQEASLSTPFQKSEARPTLKIGSTIGIARLDKGRLIYAPMVELRDWAFLDKRSGATFAPVSPSALIKNIPEVAMDGRDSDNKIDEIRLTASDLHMDYVLIYGMGKDAQWGSFAGKALANTGLTFKANEISPRAKAKAMLVDTFTGEVYGTVTSNDFEYSIGDLTDQVEILINTLTAERSPKDA